MFETKDLDLKFIELAVRLAERGLGQTWPNPTVGCIIVKENKIIGRGVTGGEGTPHAEIIALERAGENSKGADMYVSLEPCAHFGKTPPCVQAIIKAGIKRVICPIEDPDPRVSGKGFNQLKKASIEVKLLPIAKNIAKKINRGFIKKIEMNQPYVTLKLACSIDGKIATSLGQSKWISNELSRNRVQLLRAKNDAILVGTQTFKNDFPSLNLRNNFSSLRSPLRVFLDKTLSVVPHQKENSILKKEKTLIFHGNSFNKENKSIWKSLNVETIETKIENNKICIQNVLERLASMGILNLLIEGGGILATNLLDKNLVDEIIIYTSGLILGNSSIPSFTNILDNSTNLSDFPKFYLSGSTVLGDNIETIWHTL